MRMLTLTFSIKHGAPVKRNNNISTLTKKMKKILLGSSLLALCLCACDDNTESIGIYTDEDNIESTSSVFEAQTRSIAVDSVLSRTTTCYLGRVTDPETNTQIKAEFLAQFNTLENYEFPDYDLLYKNDQGEIEADSIEIRLFYKSFYGDENNPMKLEVYELDTANVIREDTSYYSNADLTSFINPHRQSPIAQKVFTARDFTLDDETIESDSYTPNIRIVLPKEYGTFIMKKYFENKNFFKNSYNFIRHVCPGFYFKLTDGNETMLNVYVGTINLFFRYKDLAQDTTYVGMTRFAATPEVLQNTTFETDDMHALAESNKDWTYLKTPAGIFTEITLPIDEIYTEHTNDSISQTQISLTRYNATSPNSLDIPQALLMVRKDNMYSFFENNELPDNKTSYVTSFSSSYNTYTFSNIGNLIAYCRKERNEKAAEAHLTPEEWSLLHPNWNKVVVIPVAVTTDDNNNILSVTNDMGLNSVRLVGGKNNPIKLQVIYSSFNKK